MVVEVDLYNIPEANRMPAVNWLAVTYGPSMGGIGKSTQLSTARWAWHGMRTIQFFKPKDATVFLLKWS